MVSGVPAALVDWCPLTVGQPHFAVTATLFAAAVTRTSLESFVQCALVPRLAAEQIREQPPDDLTYVGGLGTPTRQPGLQD